MRRLAVTCVLLGMAVALPAQTPSVEVADEVAVNYVMVPFTVLGAKGVPITDLNGREVTLLVDGARVATDLFEKSMDAPVSFTILLDGSGSMALAGKMEAARAAVRALTASRKKGDEFALFLFDDREVHEIVPFTEDAQLVLRALETVKPYGKTAFFDAVATMPARTELGKNPTRAIILLSDGIDNASRLTRLQLAAKLEGVSVPIYPLALRSQAKPKNAAPARVSEELTDVELLEEIATETGGRLFAGTKPEHFAQAVASMDRSLRAQYLLGFSPTGKGAVKYRRITLQTAGRIRSVRVRAGYRGTEPPVAAATATRGKAQRNERKSSS